MIKYIGKQIRIDKGYTVRGLAKKADIAPCTIYKWEVGTHLPDLMYLDLIAIALEVEPWDLIEFSNGKERKCHQQKQEDNT
jgi:transcriptional regulator with XRE-family HTH domain